MEENLKPNLESDVQSEIENKIDKTNDFVEKPINKVGEEVNEGKFNIWIAISIIFIIAFMLSIFTNGFTTFGQKSPDELKAKIEPFVVSSLMQGQGTFTIDSMRKVGNVGVYEMNTTVNGEKRAIYTTTAGDVLFIGFVSVTETPPVIETPTGITKTDKPQVDLYVMSYCPYGIMAEKNFIPALALLNGKIDFNLRFIAEYKDGVFNSLHGQKEVDEDMRQACIIKSYPNTYLRYVACQVPNYEAGKDLGTTYEECLSSSNMSKTIIDGCFETEGKQLLSDNVKFAADKGISGSPTWEVNGYKKVGAITSEAFKKTICSAFNTEPAECSQKLSDVSAVAAGNCG